MYKDKDSLKQFEQGCKATLVMAENKNIELEISIMPPINFRYPPWTH